MNRNITILVVDDFHVVRKTVKHQLRALGFTNVAEASDGKIAMEVVNSQPIGLVIADWNMPGKSGIDFLREMRADPRHKDIPFIMLTAEATEDAIATAVRAGVTNYIVKPFTYETLAKKLAGILK